MEEKVKKIDRIELEEYISDSNRLTRPLGVNYKRLRSSLWNPKLFLLFVACYTDLIHNLVMGLLPYDTMRREKMLYGDISTIAFDKDRNQIMIAQYCYRLSSVLMLTIFIFDKRSWLKVSSRYFDMIQTPKLCSKLLILRKRCQTFALINAVGRQSLITSAIIFISPGRFKEFGLEIIPAFVGMSFFIGFIPVLNAQFLMDLNLCVWTTVHCFKDINRRMLEDYYNGKEEKINAKYLREFADCCCLVEEMMKYCKKIFMVFYSVNIVLIVFVFFAVFFNGTLPIFMKFLIATFAFGELAEVLYFSYAIGKIDKEAKTVTNFIYKHFLIKQTMLEKDELWQYLRYYHTVWASNVGISFLGQPISPETSIKIITIAMTAMTVIMNNFK